MSQNIMEDDFMKLLRLEKPDLIFLQIDPSRFISRQRFMAHKCAFNEEEDYDVKGIEQNDPHAPESWEETVVNLNVLDMLNHNQVYSKLDLTYSFATYSHVAYQGIEDVTNDH